MDKEGVQVKSLEWFSDTIHQIDGAPILLLFFILC